MRTRYLAIVCASAMTMAACGQPGTTAEQASTAAAPAETATTATPAESTTTTVTDTPASTPFTALPEEAPGSLETELTTELRYHEEDDRFQSRSGSIDVIAPTTGGPWPTVVVFHGEPRSVSKGYHRTDAGMLAERGRVVFLPNWGHRAPSAGPGVGGRGWHDLVASEVSCAVVFARAHAEEYGGDPDHITVYGFSWGANAALMAGLVRAAPIDNCTAAGPAVVPQALVPIDADWVLGPAWDRAISDDPEVFYAVTPWRHLDGSPDIPISVMVTEDPGGSYVRSAQPDPASSWLSYRHPDIDLVADLDRRGFLSDGDFGVRESGEYAYQVLLESGYDATLVVMPGAEHMAWGEEGLETVIETVLHAER